MKKTVLTSLAILCLLSIVFLIGHKASVKATSDCSVYVPDDYAKIQWAIGNASTGDTICIRADTYYEQITIDKALTLQGEDGPIIDGNGSGTVVRVKADNVTLKGLTIRNGEVGLELYYSNNASLKYNQMLNNTKNFEVGPYIHRNPMRYLLHNIDSSNTVDGRPIYYWVNIRDAKIPQNAGYVAIINSTNIMVENQNLSRNRHGILFVQTTNSTIRNVNVSNTQYGILLGNSTNCKISNNSVRDSKYYGIQLEHSPNNIVNGNKIEYCFHGVVLLNSGENLLRNNNMTGNRRNFGVTLWYSETYLSDLINDIDTSNIVNGKRIYYRINEHDLIIDPYGFPDLGYIALINSTNVTVKNFSLSNNWHGVRIGFSNSCVVRNVTVSDCGCSISSLKGVNNTILQTTTSDCGSGIYFWNCSNSVATRNTLINNTRGFELYDSCSCEISHNLISNYEDNPRFCGIEGIRCNDFVVKYNSIANCELGIHFRYGSNTFIGNTISNSENIGLALGYSEGNSLWHNNFINNTRQLDIYDSYENSWDNGVEGNYWSDYNGVDLDPLDGIGDTAYIIDGNNKDNCPLMGMFSDFNATAEQHVQTVCNSTISDLQFNGTAISFNVAGKDGTVGFCRVCIPTALMNDTYRVFVNKIEILPPLSPLPCSNSTHSYLYFTYNHSTQEVVIIPEFPLTRILPLLMIFTVFAVVLLRKKRCYIKKQLQ